MGEKRKYSFIKEYMTGEDDVSGGNIIATVSFVRGGVAEEDACGRTWFELVMGYG